MATAARNGGEHCLKEILELTQQMLREASDEEWEELQMVEARRRQLIATCFPLRQPLADPRRAAEQIRQIVETSDMVAELVSWARDKAGETLGGLRQGRTALRAYRQAGG